jgi:hypothetical protein
MSFLMLLLVTLATATLVSWGVVRLFARSIAAILHRIVADEIAGAWTRYLRFAIFVVGISGGVRIRSLERYITGFGEDQPIVLTRERWVLELYRTVIESLQAIAWMLLVFFVFALIAYVILRAFDARREPRRVRLPEGGGSASGPESEGS